MSTPNAAYSVRMRVELSNDPAALAQLATAIGEAGGTFGALDNVRVRSNSVVHDVTIFAVDDAHVSQIRSSVESLGDVAVSAVDDLVFALHRGGKISVQSKLQSMSQNELSMAYTPGVARVCRAIAADPRRVRDLTIRGNTVAIVSDGTAVLGLGNIGPAAAMPVMEGKAMLFKEFAGIDAFPICLDIDAPTADGEDPGIDQIVEVVTRLAPTFGGVNLEDIAAPRCFAVEARLREKLDIPIFHDDQHGTAVVALAALRNALRVVGKELDSVSIVIAGAGAAGVAITKMLQSAGAKDVVVCDRNGVLSATRKGLDHSKQWVADNSNPFDKQGSLQEAVRDADVFIGVSGPNLLTAAELRTMADQPIVFALANPDPEVAPQEAEGIAAVYATGRSDYPNQINNVLCYPGIFRGALDVAATTVTENMKLAAADAIAAVIPADELRADYIIPSVFDQRVVADVSAAVARTAVADGVATLDIR